MVKLQSQWDKRTYVYICLICASKVIPWEFHLIAYCECTYINLFPMRIYHGLGGIKQYIRILHLNNILSVHIYVNKNKYKKITFDTLIITNHMLLWIYLMTYVVIHLKNNIINLHEFRFHTKLFDQRIEERFKRMRAYYSYRIIIFNTYFFPLKLIWKFG